MMRARRVGEVRNVSWFLPRLEADSAPPIPHGRGAACSQPLTPAFSRAYLGRRYRNTQQHRTPMIDDLAGKSIGARIQTTRERRGMTRETVAGLVGRSAQWLKDIEKGRRGEPRPSMLLKLADVLGVANLAELTGEQTLVPVASLRRVPHPAVPAIREAIHAQPLTRMDSPVDVSTLTARVADAWRLWHTSPTQRTDVGRILPALITDARAAARAAEGADRRAAHAVLANLYGLCEQALAWTSEPELLWLTVDRGIAAAQEAD